jgi:hypothetical protein
MGNMHSEIWKIATLHQIELLILQRFYDPYLHHTLTLMLSQLDLWLRLIGLSDLDGKMQYDKQQGQNYKKKIPTSSK